MKNNTKIRLHLSKNLFESLAAEVLTEAKKGDMSGGAYTEAVKQPKGHTKEKSSEMKHTAPTKMKKMGEMETRVAERGVKEDLRKGVHGNFEEWKKSFPEGTEFKQENNYMMAVKDGKELGKWNPIQKQGMHADDFQYKNLEEKEEMVSEDVSNEIMQALQSIPEFYNLIRTKAQMAPHEFDVLMAGIGALAGTTAVTAKAVFKDLMKNKKSKNRGE